MKNKTSKIKKIIFICKSNMFRSRISEAYLKKINKNVQVASAGVIKGDYPLHKKQIETAKEFGMSIDGKPRVISWKLIRESDLIIIVANDVPAKLFYNHNKKNKKIRWWNIKDVKNPGNIAGNKRVIMRLINKIEQLNKQLTKQNER